MAGRFRIIAGASVAAGLALASYPIWRSRSLTWGATPDEVASNLPGDELMPDAAIVTTRAIEISASPDCIWPWLVQMGSGRAGDYSYDWVENLLGLDTHSAKVILPQFQDVKLGDEFGFSGHRTVRVEILKPEQAYVRRLSDGTWVSIFALVCDNGTTRLVNRNRYAAPSKSAPSRVALSMLLEQGSLLLQRKMLLGIKERAELLATERDLAARAPRR